ncbi:MAG: FAD:protein FMN transferase [Methylococcales bacterium]|nr:FAD:protein FMN transferase [Methylococcales bacterium]
MFTRFNRVRGFYFILLWVLMGCNESPVNPPYAFNYSDGIMGTSFSIKAPHLPETIKADALKIQIKAKLDALNSQLSTYEKKSALSLFNQSDTTNWQTIPNALLTVLIEAQRISELSSGAFDISVGKLVNLWGFGVEPMRFTTPDETRLNQILTTTGYHYLSIDPMGLKIKKQVPELYLDLSAIAKGYAVDQIALLLESQGIQDYMVEIGGEIRLKGQNNTGGAWHIAIEKPTPEKRMIQKVIAITNSAMATSGDYRNFFESDGVRYSHTIDPRTGRPIKHQLASVTILSDSSMTADSLATAMMVLGENEGYKLAEKHNIAALFIIKTAEGFVEKSTSAFIEFFKEKS